MAESQPLIVIPARIGSTRLKNKPLREIGGVPLITHVCRRALEADIGPVVVSSDDERVARAATMTGAHAMVRKDFIEHCGSDRVAHAAELLSEIYDVAHIINLQGDLPFIDPQILRVLWKARQETTKDIVTALHACKYVEPDGFTFKRGMVAQHVGVYAYTRESLQRFASLPPTDTERHWSLEQLRALENGMTFDFIAVDHMPLEINTESDLKHANLIAAMLGRYENARLSVTGVDTDTPFADFGGWV